MAFKEHVEKTLRISPEPTPLFKMILSAIGVTTPLIIGYFTHHLFVSMFGSLMGLLYYLNDPFGPLINRSKHLLVTYLLLMLALAVGSVCVGNEYFIVGILFVLSYMVGKSKNFGLELERMMLFITLQFITASSEVVMKLRLNDLLLYSLIAFINYIVWAAILFKATRHEVLPMVSKRESVKKIISNDKPSWFPLTCAVFSCLGYASAKMFEFSHANWIVGTTLIVMLPDSYQSIYKSSQRVIGTTMGVLLSVAVMTYVHDPKLLILFVFILSFLMPHGISKNYWVANIYIAAMIIFFLEIAAPQSIASHHLAYWRIVDIFIGCLIGVLAALLLRPDILKRETKKVGH
ncbi:MAG: FUSC family protein [Rhizobacter sp.]|nr:FUSC family protein [Bacteriovorax sp.]